MHDKQQSGSVTSIIGTAPLEAALGLKPGKVNANRNSNISQTLV